MAHKTIPDGLKADKITRENAEKDLEFDGFLIFQCPMKKDTKDHITKIMDADCKVKIITGDNILTAAYVASQLQIVRRPEEDEKSEYVAFAKIDEQKK
jgi:P-type E1-E2 ATPase